LDKLITASNKLLHQKDFTTSFDIVTKRDFLIPLLLVLSVIGSILVLVLPFKLLMSAIFVIPAALILLGILKNPYFGIMIFYLFEFLRPYDLLPGLAKLRIPMLTVITSTVAFIFIKAWTDKSIKWDKFNWVFLSFIGVVAITVVTAWNNRFAYNVFQSMSIYFVVMLIATNVVNSTRRFSWLIWILLTIHVYFALKGILHYSTGSYSYGGMNTSGSVGSNFLNDENDFAMALNTFIPFAFFMTFSFKNVFKKLIGTGILLILIFGVISSMSRGGWIGLVAAIGFSVFRSKHRIKSLAIALLSVLALIAFAPSQYWAEVQSISAESGTGKARIEYWKAAVRMFVDNPLVGVGAANGGVRMPAYIETDRDPNTQWGRTFHGTLPQVLAELGGLGIFFYLTMIVLALKYLNRIGKISQETEDGKILVYMANSLTAAIIAYLVTATFISTAYYPQLWALLTLSITLFHISKRVRC
jgi:probable O-glycosylation ligase (exosortase A-associated)